MTVKRTLQQDTSDLFARYEVYDDCGDPVYRIRGKNTASGESMRIRDRQDNILCKVRRLGFSALGAYSISLTGGETVRLNVVVSGHAAVHFRGISFSIRGDVLSGCYDIVDADRSVICAVCRDCSGRVYLTISDDERELLCIAAVACINSLRAQQSPALLPV